MNPCSVLGCCRSHYAKGLCSLHYSRHRGGVELDREYYKHKPGQLKLCTVSDCGQVHSARGLCKQHYDKRFAKGDRHSTVWLVANRIHNNATKRRSKRANQSVANAGEARRRARKLQAAPTWANEFFIKEAYDLAQRRTRATGFEWQVDHIVPLQSKIVSGLHVEFNLRVIPAAKNTAKGNRYWPQMPEQEMRAA